jgi:hypothetical protein
MLLHIAYIVYILSHGCQLVFDAQKAVQHRFQRLCGELHVCAVRVGNSLQLELNKQE